MPPSELWLVRHARPVIAPGTCYGRLDVPADAKHTQVCAQQLGQALLAQQLQAPLPLHLTCSPSSRTRALARSFREQLPNGLEIQDHPPDPRLAEMDFGDWEGRLWDAMPREALDAWTADFHHHHPGGGESVAGLLQRVSDALSAIQALKPPQRVIWFTHAGVIRSVEVLMSKRPFPLQAADWPTSTCDHGAWRVISWPAIDRANPLQP